MMTANTNRKPAPPQASTWQETLQDYKAQMMKQQQTQQDAPESDKSTSAYKVKPTSETQQAKQAKQKPAQERVRTEGMNRRQWKNFKHMRRVLALWPELFDLDNPKPLRVGVLDDLMQDISARNLTIGKSRYSQLYAPYTVSKSPCRWWRSPRPERAAMRRDNAGTAAGSRRRTQKGKG